MRRSAAAVLCSLLLSFFSSGVAQAQTALTASGSPAPLIISTAVAGSQPVAIPDIATTYFVRVKNIAGVKKITAQIDTPMPPATTLTVALAAPSGATSLGAVSLDTTPRDVVVNISGINPGVTRGITYVFSATVAAGVIASQTRTVTLTLANFP